MMLLLKVFSHFHLVLSSGSLFHEDGTMRKCCKSDLVKQFENEVSPVLSLPDFDPSRTTYIRDGMAIVQCMDAKKHKTFGDLALAYCNYLASCFTKAHTVADVFDRVLPAVHALSGCDTTSSLFGIGKKSVYKVLKDAVLDFSDLYNLGDSTQRLPYHALDGLWQDFTTKRRNMHPAIRTLTNYEKLATKQGFKSGQIATL
ncbi:unnamed protein product [Mytilus coruscus]|uniref:Uncharacterized protein n=1 Tax=Mytilus coruscus TaxID=42192 RepID=A0A6J8C5B1_MYTCO|nr:unnamed protein product [Mytilus coruscus]